MLKTLVVGAGLSGLMIARNLRHSRNVTVFDKARGVGGRLATRRTDTAQFDHGAQFYRLKEPLREMHERWQQRQLVKLWFTQNQEQHYCATAGMTALAKDLAQDTNLILNERVTNIENINKKWLVRFDSTRVEETDEIIFTCPTPQTLDIFKASSLPYPAQLNEVVYSKALVLLIENSPTPFKFQAHGYIEPQGSSIFSIADQYEKGISKSNALTVTLAAEASSQYFDMPDEAIINHTTQELQKIDPSFRPGIIQVKKWRYCQVQKSFGELFVQVADGLYLAGDGFGGASLNGAARSAAALSKHLSQLNTSANSVDLVTKGKN